MHSTDNGNAFLDAAHNGRNGAGRWVAGTLLVVFFWLLLGGVPIVLLASGRTPSDTENYLGNNASFLFLLAGLWLAIRYIHKRTFGTLVGPSGDRGPRLGEIARGFFYWLAAMVVVTLLGLVTGGEMTFSLEPGRFLPMLPVILVLTSIQTTAEELFFRGYLLQGTGLLTRRTWLLVVVNGVLFTLPHLGNAEVSSGILAPAIYFVMGAFLALVTIRSGSLHLAIGAHAANNLFVALVVGFESSSLTTNTIFTQQGELNPATSLVSVLVTATLFWLACFGIRRRSAPVFETTR